MEVFVEGFTDALDFVSTVEGALRVLRVNDNQIDIDIIDPRDG